jgi:hypothetical protein
LIQNQLYQGLCPSEIARLERGGFSNAMVYYITPLDQDEINDHSNCAVAGPFRAQQYEAPPEESRYLETCQISSCIPLGPGPDLICSILEKETEFPRFRFQKCSSSCLLSVVVVSPGLRCSKLGHRPLGLHLYILLQHHHRLRWLFNRFRDPFNRLKKRTVSLTPGVPITSCLPTREILSDC